MKSIGVEMIFEVTLPLGRSQTADVIRVELRGEPGIAALQNRVEIEGVLGDVGDLRCLWASGVSSAG